MFTTISSNYRNANIVIFDYSGITCKLTWNRNIIGYNNNNISLCINR